MPMKPAGPKLDDGPVTRGKGLDSLEGFIIHNWAAPTRFGIWGSHAGALAAPKAALEPFFNRALMGGWLRDGTGAVITIDPPRDPFVTLRVDYENRNWTPESKYNPKHWVWKVVPPASVLASLEAALDLALPEGEAAYLRTLREGRLREAWGGPAGSGVS